MKKYYIITLFLLLFNTFYGFSQDCEIHLMSVISDTDNRTPENAKQFLQNRLEAIINSDGISATSNYAQFFITSKSTILSEQTLATAPPKTSLVLSLDLYIGDAWGEKVFAQTSIELRNVGNSREQAYLAAYRTLNKSNKALSEFIKTGKQKIINYYDTEYPNILKEADRYAQMKDFDRAIYLLSVVPACCKGYNASTEKMLEIFQTYIDLQNHKILQQAKMAWAASPDKHGAEKAGEYLGQIEPYAACFNEAMNLYQEIKEKVKSDWDFEMKQKYSDEIELKKLKIEAAKAIGVAFGNNQKAHTTNLLN